MNCCIDKISGTVDGGAVSLQSTDIDLESRPFNLKWDIGADETK